MIYFIAVSNNFAKEVECLMCLIGTYLSLTVYFNCVINFKQVNIINSFYGKVGSSSDWTLIPKILIQMNEILERFKNNWLNLKNYS